MKKSIIPQLIFVFVLISGVTIAQDDELKTKVKEMSDAMVEAMMNEDFEALKSFYDEKAISLPNYDKMLKGQEAIMSHMKQGYDSGMKFNEISFTPVKVKMMGEQALEIGKYKMSITMPGAPDVINDEGKYITIYNVMEDGSLKIALEMWNTDAYPMPMSASSQGME